VTASFAYDALGRRIAKTINGQTTTFHYDGLDIVQEAGGAGEASYLRTLAIDEALARIASSGTNTFLADLLGSTLALADPSGSPVTEYTYEPFGATQVSGPTSPNPVQFNGRENDGSGLYHYRARFYAPALARFVSQDPFETEPGYGNRFAYARNNPLLYTDPTGEQSQGGIPAPMLLKPIESPLVSAAAIGGIISTGIAQVGVGAVTAVVGAQSIPLTGPAGLVVAGAGRLVATTGALQIGAGIALIPYLFPLSAPPPPLGGRGACPIRYPATPFATP
jgi:RHS repeat-associated protein